MILYRCEKSHRNGDGVYCTCGCTRLVATRYDWDDNPYYEVSMETSNVRYNCDSLRERIVDAVKVLFGKRPAYADMTFDSKEDFEEETSEDL